MIPNKPPHYASLSIVHDGLTELGVCAYVGLYRVGLRVNSEVDGLSIYKRFV
jgi:hypothetical protein